MLTAQLATLSIYTVTDNVKNKPMCQIAKCQKEMQVHRVVRVEIQADYTQLRVHRLHEWSRCVWSLCHCQFPP